MLEYRLSLHVSPLLQVTLKYADEVLRFLCARIRSSARPKYVDGKYTSLDGFQPFSQYVLDPNQESSELV